MTDEIGHPSQISEGGIVYPEESYAIMGAAYEVYRTMGPGFQESVYQEALEIELSVRGIPFDAMKPISIFYKGQRLQKVFQPDFVCYSKIILEIKAVEQIGEREYSQLMNYLKAANMKLGLLLNFGQLNGLGKKRVVT
jgi:GxxExxY protein